MYIMTIIWEVSSMKKRLAMLKSELESLEGRLAEMTFVDFTISLARISRIKLQIFALEENLNYKG